MATTTSPSRREQRRQQTLDEIKAAALEQIGAGGPEAVSLNGIARSMAMSPAAIYRYFDNREALLADLVVDLYSSLADDMEAAHRAHPSGGDGLAAVAHAYRDWALEHPNGYRLIFQTLSGSGQDLAPERTIPAATRSMSSILAALTDVSASASDDRQAPSATPDGLDDPLRAWGERSGAADLPLEVLRLGMIAWTRLHGVVSLELGHHLASTGVPPELVYGAEVDALIREAHARLGA